MSTTGIAYTYACHLYHVDVEISTGYSICHAVIILLTWVQYYYHFTTSVAGAYSPCMQGMHCMPSHLAKKENNNLNKYM